MKMYAQCQAAYGAALAMATILNSILRAFELDHCGTSLAEDSASFVDEIIILAERASPFRPLAASHVPVCLTAGWAATDDHRRKVEIEKYLAEYETDFAISRWLEGAIWLKSQYGRYRRRKSLTMTPFPDENQDFLDNSRVVDANNGIIIREPNATAAMQPASNSSSSCDVQ